jgi:GT2 family glycosyltransferase
MIRPDAGLEPCDAVSGFLFAARRSTWEAVGGFDEAYAPASWEEIDFNVAVQRGLGLRSYAVGGVDAPHEWGISSRQKPWKTVRWGGRRELLWSIHRRNRRHFLAKWSAT